MSKPEKREELPLPGRLQGMMPDPVRETAATAPEGLRVIDLSVGSPDVLIPEAVRDSLLRTVEGPDPDEDERAGAMARFRKQFAGQFKHRYGVKLDPEKEVLLVPGTKEAIGHLPLCVLNPGEGAFIPDPCYGAYEAGVLLAGGNVIRFPLLESHRYLPDAAFFTKEENAGARLLYLNYPNNPTGAIAPLSFFKEIVAAAKSRGLVIVQDAVYSPLVFDDQESPSILQADSAKDCCVEFYSFSRPYYLGGWHLGVAVGNEKVLQRLATVLRRIRPEIPAGVVKAGCEILKYEGLKPQAARDVYRRRRDLWIGSMNRMGWKCAEPASTYYCWMPVPPGYTSAELAERFIQEMAIRMTPGNLFGPNGEGYFRISLTVPEEDLKEALERIRQSHKHSHHQ